MIEQHAQDVVAILLWAIGGLGALITGLASILWAVGLSVVKTKFTAVDDQFTSLQQQNLINIASVKAEIEDFKRADEARHKEANEKIDALFDLHRRIEDVMHGELRTLERAVANVRERIVVVESRCSMSHPPGPK